MPANPTEVMTEQEKKLRDYIADGMNGGSPLKLSSEQRQTVVHIIDRLSDQSISLRSSRDEYQTALELKHKWMVEADATIERLENTARLMMEGRDKARADLSAARAEVSRLSGELASRPAKELVEAAKEWRETVSESPYLGDHHSQVETERRLIKAVDALSQASSADALSAPEKEGVVLLADVRKLLLSEMEKRGVLKVNLAEKLGHSRAHITQTLSNGHNMTIDTANEIAAAIGITLVVSTQAFSPAPVAAPASAVSPATFQSRVVDWMMACFSNEICRDTTERNHRFLEESLELVQSLGCTQSEAHQLVDYVFSRPKGEPVQEAGGVMVTLAALCNAACLDMAESGEVELKRVWTKIDVIRAKQAAKPKHSPLPAVSPASEEKDAKGELTDTQLRNCVAILSEDERLGKLSNVELVAECCGTDAADYMVVNEMMTRLDPDWSKRDENDELPPTPAPAPSDGAPGAAKKDHLQGLKYDVDVLRRSIETSNNSAMAAIGDLYKRLDAMKGENQ